MSTIFGVPVDAAYYVVSTLAAALTPLTGGLAVAVAIVASTVAVRLLLLPLSYYALRGQVAQSRLAPQLHALRQRHRGDPDRLTREARALYRDHGTTMFAGYLPLLLQWPLLSVMYLLFRSGTVGGMPNTLLRHHLFTVLFGAHWLTAPGPLSGQGAVFAGLFALLIVAGYLAARVSRRLFPASAPSPAPGSVAAPSLAPGSVAAPSLAPGSVAAPSLAPGSVAAPSLAPGSVAAPSLAPGSVAAPSPAAGSAAAASAAAGSVAAPSPAAGSAAAASAAAGSVAAPSAAADAPAPGSEVASSPWIARLTPLLTVVFAAFLPLAGVLCLLTTTAWTLLERRVFAHYLPPAEPPVTPRPANT